MLNVPNLVFYLREGVSWCSVPVSSIVSSIGRGCLLSMILFVLKEEHAGRSCGGDDVVVDENDGGLQEVGKMKGSGTFVVLNMLVGLWAVGGECVKLYMLYYYAAFLIFEAQRTCKIVTYTLVWNDIHSWNLARICRWNSIQSTSSC